MECRLALIRDDFDTRERDGHLWDVAASFLFVAVLMAAMWFRIPVLFSIPPAFVAGYLFKRWSRRRLSDWAGPMDQMGWLILTPVSIRVEREVVRSYDVNAEWSVHVDSNHIQGESMFYRDKQPNGLGTITATGASEHVDLKFLIANKEQQVAFKEVLSAWYRSGVRVSESLNGYRIGILLLRSYHSYADMKRAKADLLPYGASDH